MGNWVGIMFPCATTPKKNNEKEETETKVRNGMEWNKKQQRQANRTMNQDNRGRKRRQLQSYVRKRHQSDAKSLRKKPVQTILTKSH